MSMNKPVIGQVVYMLKKEELIQKIVTSVGSKYFYINATGCRDHTEDKVLLSNWIASVGNNKHRVYPDEQAILQEKEEKELCLKIADCFVGEFAWQSPANKRGIDIDALRLIASIIDLEAGKNNN